MNNREHQRKTVSEVIRILGVLALLTFICRLVLTEGPMKADVINALTGLTVLAVPGVNTLTQLESTLTELRSDGLVEIKTAFDMDFTSNHHVQHGYNNLLQLLGDMGFRYGTYLWDPAYKGLDDYIWEHLLRKEKSK